MTSATLARQQRTFARQVYTSGHDESGFGIYRRGTLALRIKALEKIFPVCLRVVGAACFEQAAREALGESRAGVRRLDDEGHTLSDTWARLIKTREALHDFGYLPDLCRFELLKHRIEQLPLAPESTWHLHAQHPASSLAKATLTLSQTFATFETSWPLLALFTPSYDTTHMAPLWVFRDPHTLELHQGMLTPAQARLLSCVASGVMFEDLCDHDLTPHVFQECVRAGWLTGFDVPEEMYARSVT